MSISNRVLFGVVGAAVVLIALIGIVVSNGSGLPRQNWAFTGPFAELDRAAARRGFQVYAQSCSNCHSMDYLHYRDLAGIGMSESQIASFAGSVTVPTGFDSQGNVVTAPATPASRFRAPFASQDAARDALNGAYPPDLSLSLNTFPRGPDYVYALLTGYQDLPADTVLADGMSYNTVFPGHQIAMPPPLNEGQISYTDATVSTVSQNAHDVVTFLAWSAHPEMTQRRRIGFGVVLYLLALGGITWLLKRKIWATVR
jgi:ubiquinol-cytochrome c reductase cytochrome c1 subunit